MSTLLTDKELKDIELVRHHKEMLERFMKNELSWKKQRRDVIWRVYDKRITAENIRYYFNRDMRLFLKAMIFNKLPKIANYYPVDYDFITDRQGYVSKKKTRG
jgi:hypothetical protein